MVEPYQLTAWEAADLLARKELSSRELTESVLQRIERTEPVIHAYQTVLRDSALAAADAIDESRAHGEAPSRYAGVPLALKDNMCMQGSPTTCSSRMLESFVPPYDATVVQKCMAAGLIPVGKTNMDEFAMGSSTENSAFGRTMNPWDLDRVPGGSSGGSTAAVSADETILSLGSDTGGSIRQPAAFCSVTGLKPTYGRVSRYGLVAFASSLDQIGPITKDVRDAALLLQIISGVDSMDSTSVNAPVPDYPAALTGEIKGLRIGVPKEYFPAGLNAEIRGSVEKAVQLLKEQGAEVVELSLPKTDYAIATYYLICTAEASSNLARYEGVVYGRRGASQDNILEMYMSTRSEGFGPEVKRRIMLGTYVLSAGFFEAYYRRAQKVRTLFRQEFEQAFKQVDVIMCPATPSPPFKAGEKTDDPLEMYLSDVFTAPLNMAGLPGLVVPGGFSASGLPIGVQFIGPVFGEEKILNAGYAYQQLTDHHRQKPPLVVPS
ncbi:MAG: Asp-tRNA(Asn)/Glu-tRNA(Gln) amidotransferase subunit GatA [bacterium]|nr:Asp-tRNA(Asn)/Glu-tRNA(Gln) amidotransferase subunit GatA [bacterium]